MNTPIPVPEQLEAILADVPRCIDQRLFYPALLISLTIPDICVGLTLDESVFVTKAHYVKFVDTYIDPISVGTNGLGCYQLRGGIVHRANLAGHAHIGATHVIFTVPQTGIGMWGFGIEMPTGGRTATGVFFDLVSFCQNMDAAARAWYQDHKGDPKVIENLPKLIRFRPWGIAPMVPMPVVASGPG